MEKVLFLYKLLLLKRLFILIICIGIAISSIGKDRNYSCYGEIGYGGGNFNSFKLGLNGIYKKFAFGITFYNQWADATGVPSDYHAGFAIFGSGTPQQSIGTCCISGGWVFNTHSAYMRYVVKGGLVIGTYNKPTDYTKIPPVFFGSNYDVTTKDYAAVGFCFNPTVEFPLGAGFGFAAGAFGNLNTGHSTFGFEASIIFGRLRNRIEHMR